MEFELDLGGGRVVRAVGAVHIGLYLVYFFQAIAMHSRETGPRQTKKKKISSIYEKVNCV